MQHRFVIRSDPGELRATRAEVRRAAACCPLSAEDRDLIVLAVDEACTNIIRHAYAGAHDRPIRIHLEAGPRRLRITLRDYGTPVRPATLRGRSLRRAAPGGLGLHLMRTAFDEVRYIPCRRGTRLTLRRRFGAPGPARSVPCQMRVDRLAPRAMEGGSQKPTRT